MGSASSDASSDPDRERSLTESDPILRIRLAGEFDLASNARLSELLKPAETVSAVSIDLSETSYIDSTALGCFIRLRKKMGPTAVIRLRRLRPHIRRIFALTELDRLFEIED